MEGICSSLTQIHAKLAAYSKAHGHVAELDALSLELENSISALLQEPIFLSFPPSEAASPMARSLQSLRVHGSMQSLRSHATVEFDPDAEESDAPDVVTMASTATFWSASPTSAKSAQASCTTPTETEPRRTSSLSSACMRTASVSFEPTSTSLLPALPIPLQDCHTPADDGLESNLSTDFSMAHCPSAQIQAFPSFHKTTSLRRGVDDDGAKTINEYTIMAELGRGAYGKVKLALRNNDETDIRAIKILKKSMLKRVTGGEGLSQFQMAQKEVALMKKMRHASIARLHEVIDDPAAEKMYLVMQYIDGGPIVAAKPDDGEGTLYGTLEIADAFRYTRQLASALAYLHKHNVVHRDIKPDNVLVHFNGQGEGRAMLVDFGVSTTLARNDDSVTGLAGSPSFFSPEACRGEQNLIGPAQDMWALGVTLFIMLFGYHPFHGRSAAEVMASIAGLDTFTVPPIPPNAARDERHATFFATVLPQLLSISPEDRLHAGTLHRLAMDVTQGAGEEESLNSTVHLDWSDLDNAITSNTSEETGEQIVRLKSFFGAALPVQFIVKTKSMLSALRRHTLQ